MSDSRGMIQVVVPPVLAGPFKKWLASRGLSLFPILVEGDLPTFGIGHADDCVGTGDGEQR